MAIPLVFREQAFNSSDFHVQVKIQRMPEKLSKDCEIIRIAGLVEKIFKSRALLEINSSIEFDIPVMSHASIDMPDGGFLCCFEDLVKFKKIEVCLNGSPPNLDIAADLFEIVEQSTDHPVMVFQSMASSPKALQKNPYLITRRDGILVAREMIIQAFLGLVETIIYEY